MVTVSGPGGYRLYYAHLEDFGPQEVGDWVEAGEIIGTVGNSGNAAISSTHLHYGIYEPSGRALNPYTLHPMEIAGQIAVLDLATHGRAYLGLARGSWLDQLMAFATLQLLGVMGVLASGMIWPFAVLGPIAVAN